MWQQEISSILHLLKYDPLQPLMFNSGFFIYFFVVVILGYNFIKNDIKLRSLYLMLVSFFFYYKSSGVFLAILIYIILSDFLIARKMSSCSDSKIKKQWLLLSLVTNIGMLCYFKYTNFFLGSMSELFGGGFQPFDIVLPVGISFFTFQSMSYSIDVYKGKIQPLNNPINYAFYVSFFPQLVAGPIVRARDFIPQITRPTLVTDQMIGKGVFLIISGLFKKVVISDYISVNFVDRIFDAPNLYSGFENLMGVYGYALQIYCDFSGYSDMAIGIALLLGFHFCINFDSPYQSASITEFWRRWHISLSSWLKDYLYISLGGNRKGNIRTYVNLMLTMLLGGLWHGASVVFIIWGAWHGLLLALDKLRMKYIQPCARSNMRQFITRVANTVITFHLVCIGWIFFRSDSLNTALQILTQIGNGINSALIPQFAAGYTGVLSLIIIGYVLHALPKRCEEFASQLLAKQNISTLAIIISIFVLIIIQVRSSEIMPFIYFRF